MCAENIEIELGLPVIAKTKRCSFLTRMIAVRVGAAAATTTAATVAAAAPSH